MFCKGFFRQVYLFVSFVFILFFSLQDAFAAEPPIAINESNFPDIVLRTYVQNFDKDDDGSLSQEEIDEVDVISLSNSRALRNVKGIEHFVKLKQLSISNSLVSEVDLSPFPGLEMLNCYDTEIKMLDLSNNPLLKTLQCGSNSGIQFKGLDKLTVLKSLTVSYCVLKTFDFSLFPLLETVNCSGNAELDPVFSPSSLLTEINASSTALSTIAPADYPNLKTLNCSNTNINSLDVSRNSELVSLKCSSTDISSIDVTQNSKLETLDCSSTDISELDVRRNSSLRSLSFSNTDVAEIDVSKNTELVYLYLTKTKVTQLDVSQNKKLQSLYFNLTDIPQIDLSVNTDLRILYCYSTQISNLELGTLTELSELNMSDNAIETIDFSKNTKLSILNCSQTLIRQLDLQNNVWLTRLDCSRDSISQLDLTNQTRLTALNCSRTRLTVLDVSPCTPLKDLYINHTRIPEIDLSANIALEYLQADSTLISSLDCSKNKALGEIHLQYCPLQSLDLRSNSNLASAYLDYSELTDLFLPSASKLGILKLSHTRVNSLDVSTVPNLTTLEMEKTPIKQLDLSLCPNLIYLKINGSQLSSLDLTNNGKVSEMYGPVTSHHQTVNRKNELDLSKLPGFDPERSRHWINAEREGDILRLKEGVDTTSYYYMTHFSPEGSEELVSNDSIRIGMKVEMEPIIADTVRLSISANDFEMVRDQAPTYTVSIEVPANSNVIDEPHDAVQLKIDLKKQGEEVPVSRLQYIDLPTVGPLGDPATGTFTLEAVAVLENYLTEAGTYDITYSLVNASDKKVYEGEYWVLKQSDPMTLTVREKVPYPVADPVILPEDDLVAFGDKVSITCTTPEAQIFYSLGKDVKPTFLYGDDTDLEITQGVTYVNAYTLYVDEDTSEVFSRKFKVAVEPVIFKPTSGYVEKGDTIYLSCATPGATIEFSMGEGVEPFELYEDTVIVITDDYTVLNAWAYFPDGDTTRIYTEEYNAKAPPGYVDGSEVYLPTNLQAFPSRDSVWLVWDAHYDHIYEAYVADSSSGEVVFEDTVSEFGLHTDFMLSGLDDGVYTWKVRVVGLEISPETIFDTVTEYVEGPNFRIDRSVSNGGLGPWLWEDGGIAGLLSKVVVYPNPSSGEFYLRFPSSLLSLGNPLVEVFSLQGMKLFSQEVSASPMYFNLQGLETGVFFLRISLREGSVSRRIVIF